MKVLVIAMLTSCATAAQVEPVATPTPWCFKLDVRTWGIASACSESQRFCQHARDRAVAWSSLAGFQRVGQCRRVP